MRASSDRLAGDNDGLRASDAERDEAIGHLRDRFAEGRLSQDTFLARMDAAMHAKDKADLSVLFADLPAPVRMPERRSVGTRIRERLTLLRQVVTGPANRAALLTGRTAPAYPQLPALWLPPQTDRRLTIGRALACDFTLADQSVSRWHARLYRKDEDWLLSDLGSTNGTRLNGWRVTTGVPVHPGDQVSFGSVTFVISDRAQSIG
jgi:Domain of unknown function (DUF1707)/Inner membrane component of T3SS, cytoplasmic domain